MDAWQRGPARVILADLKPSTRQVLHVTESMERLAEVNIPSGKISLFSKPIESPRLHHWRMPKQLTWLSRTSGNHVPKALRGQNSISATLPPIRR